MKRKVLGFPVSQLSKLLPLTPILSPLFEACGDAKECCSGKGEHRYCSWHDRATNRGRSPLPLFSRRQRVSEGQQKPASLRQVPGTLASGALLLLTFNSSQAIELAVRVDNLSKPVLCAEEDNVTLTFTSSKVRSYRIEAAHPAYLASLKQDNWKADWTSCSFGPGVDEKAQTAATTTKKKAAPPKLPERITLYEAVDRWLVGLKFPGFWRKSTAGVRVGRKVTEGLHLLQLWRVRPNGGEEVLVMYPQDGYWRARPIAPKGRDLTAFGSSFLIGPVEHDGRPLVRLKQITYRPELEGFDLAFANGGSARVKLTEASTTRLALDVTFSDPIDGKPFAALRSMYVTAYNNDVARVAFRGRQGWIEAGIMELKVATTPELWAGRHEISRHNTSSPDMSFKWFRE